MSAEQAPVNRTITKPGAALKALRLKHGWSLSEVSRRSGLPISSLSKVENDKMDLTLDKLVRVSIALETDIAQLFTPVSAPAGQSERNGRRSIVRAGEGKAIESSVGHYRYLAYDLLHKLSIPMIIEVTARSLEEFGEFNRHPGEELVYVIEGELDLYTSLYVPESLKKGDSIYFDSNMGHAYIAAGDGPCRILSVCVAPEPELLKLIEHKIAPEKTKAKEVARSPAAGKRPTGKHKS